MNQPTNTAVAKRPAKPIDTVRDALGRMEPEFVKVLPKHLTPDRLMRVALTACQNTPKLLECDKRSLYSAIMTCASLGLEPDGILGQAYLVPFGGKVQFIPGYKGLLSLARNSGEVSSISAHEVRANDLFDFAFGLDERCEHVPARGDRGPITHFYAVARFKDGGRHFDVMTVEEVEDVRDGSQGWKFALSRAKRDKDGNITSANSPWFTHFPEMGKKTMIRRIAKYLPLSVQKAVSIADAADMGQSAHIDRYGDVTIDGEYSEADPSAQIEGGASKLDEFEKRVADEGEGGGESVNQETGEVTKGDDGDPLLESLEVTAPLQRKIEAWWDAHQDELDLIENEQPKRFEAIRDAYSTKIAEAEQKAEAAERARDTGELVK